MAVASGPTKPSATRTAERIIHGDMGRLGSLSSARTCRRREAAFPWSVE
jgi:hypothetical protein